MDKELYFGVDVSKKTLDPLSGVSWQKEGLDFLPKTQPFFLKQLFLYFIYI